MKSKILLLFILTSSYAFSQSVNDYQYVIVPVKYDFLSKEDQYGLNTLTKLLLQKYGFKVYLSNEEIPLDLDRCNFLYANVTENSGMFNTKLKVALNDCKEKVVFETQFGSSREKEFAVAYNQAFRESGKSFDKLNYKYNGKNNFSITQKPSKTIVSETDSETFYFAQPTDNGFQVIDNEPKVIMKLYNTSQKNVFLGIKGTINGVVISKENHWFFEYYENGKLISELLNLKF
jgi:hypothetical protein